MRGGAGAAEGSVNAGLRFFVFWWLEQNFTSNKLFLNTCCVQGLLLGLWGEGGETRQTDPLKQRASLPLQCLVTLLNPSLKKFYIVCNMVAEIFTKQIWNSVFSSSSGIRYWFQTLFLSLMGWPAHPGFARDFSSFSIKSPTFWANTWWVMLDIAKLHVLGPVTWSLWLSIPVTIKWK